MKQIFLLIVLILIVGITRAADTGLNRQDACQVEAVKSAINQTIRLTHAPDFHEAKFILISIKERPLQSPLISKMRGFEVLTSNGSKNFSFKVVTFRGRIFNNQPMTCRVSSIASNPEPSNTNTPSSNESSAIQSFTGFVIEPLFGIGGETTGIGYKVDDGGYYELVLPEAIRAEFNGLNDKRVKLTGRLIFLDGVETQNRPAIEVISYELL